VARVFPRWTALGTATVAPGPALDPESIDLSPAIEAPAPGASLAVVVSDQTRKTGVDRLLPRVWSGWAARGVCLERSRIVVACGTHRGPTHDELQLILGPAFLEQVQDRVLVHDAFTSPCRRVGRTSRGTPVAVAEAVLDVDAVVTFGAVLFHYFAGFAGGPKSIVPGVAAAETIAANHSLSVDPDLGGFAAGVELGGLDGNPVAEDLREAAALIPVLTSVQTVLLPNGDLGGVFVGDPEQAHARARECARRVFAVPRNPLADLVLASAGPARNWVQSHKALVNACRALAPGGVAVLMAPCEEGIGSASLTRWLGLRTPAAVVARLRREADINAQTALSTLTRGPRALLVSDLDPAAAELVQIPLSQTLTAALMTARERLSQGGNQSPGVRFMPQAWVTVPE
jgi:nickel-dependent lactate racemase